MNLSPGDVDATDRARHAAERHRHELAQTLEALGAKIGHKVQAAQHTREVVKEKIDGLEDRARRPLEWVKLNPWAAMGIALAAGFFFAGAPKKRRRHGFDDEAWRALKRSYEAGRRDEFRALTADGVPFKGDPGGDMKELLGDLARAIGGLTVLLGPLLNQKKKLAR